MAETAALLRTTPAPSRLDQPAFRALFPALREKTYLSICDKMILADPVRASVDTFLDRLAQSGATRVDHESLVETGRRNMAKLLGATPAEIAVTRNVSDGINSLVWAFPFVPGDNVVIALKAEHPNNIYPWLRLRSRGIELRMVAAPEGRIDAEAMLAACDERTRVMTVPSVSFSPGLRTDLGALARGCDARGVFLVVDGVQSAGILHHDFAADAPGAFATSTSKGLLGLYGYGFMFVRNDWLEKLEPAYLSRSGVDLGNGDASAMGSMDYRLHGDARRFELGSYNLAGAYAADASLELLTGIGTRTIEAHVTRLSRRLADGLARLGLAVTLPHSEAERSHIVTVGRLDAGGHGYSDDAQITALYERLTRAGVTLTLRRGQLRFGIHYYNDDTDIDRVLDLASA